jgi:hypothetical protein
VLETAISAGVIRPRAYHEVARLRFAELARADPNGLFSAIELGPVIEPLRIAIAQAPPLPEAFALLGEALMRARDEPAAGDLDALVRGASLFRWRPALCYRLAVVLARHGRNAEAAAIVEDAMARAVDDPSRVKLVELQFLLGRARR